MLNKDDEARVTVIIGVLQHDIENFGEGLDVKAQLWMAEKLKECNDELKEQQPPQKILKDQGFILEDQGTVIAYFLSGLYYCSKATCYFVCERSDQARVHYAASHTFLNKA